MEGTHHGSGADTSQASDNSLILNRCDDSSEEACLLASHSEHNGVEINRGQHLDKEGQRCCNSDIAECSNSQSSVFRLCYKSGKPNEARNLNFVEVDLGIPYRPELPYKNGKLPILLIQQLGDMYNDLALTLFV